MQVNGHDVGVGDWLRCYDDDWEGQVIDVSGTGATLRMNSGDLRAVTAGQVHWNWWSPQSVGQVP